MDLTNTREDPNDFVSNNLVEVLQKDFTNTLHNPGKNIYSTIQRLPTNLQVHLKRIHIQKIHNQHRQVKKKQNPQAKVTSKIKKKKTTSPPTNQ
jgi:phage terminase Nu1 subunit (DNA packaging protein)